jgi:hypothetical protein
MPVDIHLICKHGDNHWKIAHQEYETGNWANISDATADEAVGGRVYLHERQDADAWHGGRITGWRISDVPGRNVFAYVVDAPFRIRCPGPWGQEKAIVRR